MLFLCLKKLRIEITVSKYLPNVLERFNHPQKTFPEFEDNIFSKLNHSELNKIEHITTYTIKSFKETFTNTEIETKTNVAKETIVEIYANELSNLLTGAKFYSNNPRPKRLLQRPEIWHKKTL